MNKKKCVITVLAGIIVLLSGCALLLNKLTYLEDFYFSYTSDDIISVNASGMELEERFEMPCELLTAFTVKIGNYERDSNARWEWQLRDSSGKEIMSKPFRFIDAKDNAYYIIDIGRTLKVNKGQMYSLLIRSLDVNGSSRIAFYMKQDVQTFNSRLLVDGQETAGSLCVTVRGGDRDLFWAAIYAFFVCLTVMVVFRGLYVHGKGLDWRQDTALKAILTGIIVFLAYLPFANTNISAAFTDENDNIRGGMIIANGGVLYKDYVVQHTPVAYYLCAIFARIGASSVEQMRLLFYIVLGVVWGLLYLRYHKAYGDKTMMLLPVLILLLARVLIGRYAAMVLSDTIQAVCLIMLLLEFLMYLKDRELNGLRSCIIAFAVWVSFGSAFVSVYSICVLFMGFVVMEFRNRKEKRLRAKTSVKRYAPLMALAMIPPVAGILYFKLNHALYAFYEQAYLFNREVYPHYQGMGKNIIEPFISGLSAMFNSFVDSVLAFGRNSLSTYHIVMVALVGLYIAVVIRKIYKEPKSFVFWAFISLFICAGAARGAGADNFHAMAFWGLMITMVAVVILKEIKLSWSGFQPVVITVLTCLFLQPYIAALVGNVRMEQTVIGYTDSRIVSNTQDGERIFIDAYCNDSIYLLAKNRYPVNRAVYCLPWYMDWYEKMNLSDLHKHRPNIVVWNPERVCWDRKYYANELNDYITANYTRVEKDSIIWEANSPSNP